MTIKEIKELLQDPSLNADTIKMLRQDERKGVKKLLASYDNKLAKLKKKQHEFDLRFSYERKFWQNNQLVAGVDEVGRGPLAGPVVTAAVILPEDFNLIDVNDSKKLSPQKRAELYPKIMDQAISVAIGIADNEVIDKINIYEADRLAMKQAVSKLKVKPDGLLVDAMEIDSPLPQIKLIKGDAKSNSIGAASIVAKVYRDNLMNKYAEKYPQYDFVHNAGYGTPKHIAALKKYGPTPIHRKTFAPVSDFFN
ncbi:ribonuclease HII [Lactobacillus sp. PV012]|uniref:ribonuclease HII n=1 Tax=Lactobacillus sp. PV012 TaxID=2594494 RepID=UPI002240B361|nr:ribonuclease HII [Lactobacillus sp. PV012]QNQ82352.1 ribonuclease HII [Lactobacillus sp. PV012]